MEYRKHQSQDRVEARRIYTLCSFDRGLVVPKVQLIDAVTDDEAVAFARGSDLCSLREVWDRHRLVAVIQPRNLEAARP
jgi:hypothetical protein